MTPLQFAKQECSNFNADGSCAGIGIHDDGRLYSFGHKPKCLLADKQKCRFFEECVLPMGIDPVNAVNVVRAKDRAEALALYSNRAPRLAKMSGRLCPQCQQREVEPPKRLCYVCAEANQKRANQRRIRT